MNSVIRKVLVESAKIGSKIQYGDLMQQMGLDHRNEYDRGVLSTILEKVSEFENSKKRPMLSSIVVYKLGNEVGPGFFKMVIKLG